MDDRRRSDVRSRESDIHSEHADGARGSQTRDARTGSQVEKLVSFENDPAARPDSAADASLNPVVNIDAPKRRISVQEGVRLCVAAVIIGAVAGASIALLDYAIAWVTSLCDATWWLPWMMPVAGLVTYGVYRALRIPFTRSTSDVIDSARVSLPVRIVLAPAIFVGTCLTVLCGGSAGKEGTAMQLGGAIASRIGGLVGLHKRRYQEVLLMAGIAAGLSAVLSAPVAAFIFVFEVMHQLSKRCVRIVVPLIASFVSWAVAESLGAGSMIDLACAAIDVGEVSIVQLLVVGVCCGVCSLAFCKALAGLRMRIVMTHRPVVALVVGGVLFGALLCTNDVFRPFAGTGAAQMNLALSGQAMPAYGFAVKMLLTVITLSFGFKGGEVMPTLAIGACLGAALVYVLPVNQSALVALSMIAFFAAATNCPVASIALGTWLFGVSTVPAMILVCVVATLISIQTSVYRSARIEYSLSGVARQIKAQVASRKTKSAV